MAKIASITAKWPKRWVPIGATCVVCPQMMYWLHWGMKWAVWGPFALQENVTVFFDEHVAQMPTLNCGSGKNDGNTGTLIHRLTTCDKRGSSFFGKRNCGGISVRSNDMAQGSPASCISHPDCHSFACRNGRIFSTMPKSMLFCVMPFPRLTNVLKTIRQIARPKLPIKPALFLWVTALQWAPSVRTTLTF